MDRYLPNGIGTKRKMDKSRSKIISDELCKIIMKCVKPEGYSPGEYNQTNDLFPSELFLKIDLLERMLELLRVQNKYLENNLPIELFIQGNVVIEDGSLHFIAPHKQERYRSGTPPIQLQSKLLLFLFFRNLGGGMKVYDVINNFITVIWGILDPLDFKKTQTGVTRCFTNTRFAANTLRRYGLLKFTKREAYKTWVLSPTGLLVASELASKQNWILTPVKKDYPYELHPYINDTFNDLKNYSNFVTRFLTLCKPNSRVFDEFKQGSQKAYSLLKDYWAVMWNSELKKEERRKKSQAYLRRIEQDPEVKDFYEEFKKCVHVGELLMTK